MPTLAVGVGAVLLIIFLIAMAIINGFAPSTPTQRLSLPTSGANTPQATPTIFVTLVPTSTPTPSNIWAVSEIIGKENINGYNGLVISLRNISTGEIKRAQCQQPRWKVPELGHQYRLINTFSSQGVEYWLYIPIEGVEDTTFQRFAPIP